MAYAVKPRHFCAYTIFNHRKITQAVKTIVCRAVAPIISRMLHNLH